MNQKEIKELIELLVEKDITEFELERGDMKVHVKRGGPAAPVVHVAPAVSAVQPLAGAVMPAVSRGRRSSATASGADHACFPRSKRGSVSRCRLVHREVAHRRHVL